MSEQWPPVYGVEFEKRFNRIMEMKLDPTLIEGAKIYYRNRPAEFINDWCITYDPRKSGVDSISKMPFIFFKRQFDLINFLEVCIRDNANGLIEKSRDMGATWACTAFSIHQWLFVPGTAIGWGSRKEMLVDSKGDPDSIFQKMRMQIEMIPRFFLPSGWGDSHMKLINGDNGNTITGEAGDNIGRGGRKTMYFKDESAHYERPERIEAALGDNTNVQIDISSVNGTGNVFQRRREGGEVWRPNDEPIEAGVVRVFIMDWRDHPAKDQAWYDARRKKAEREGLMHLFAQEVDRDYSASIVNMIIHPTWVKAAIDAHKILGIDDSGRKIAGLDVSDEGGDKNALVIRQGIVIKYVNQWAEGDTGDTARRAITHCNALGCKNLQYDSVGVGSGVKAETNRMLAGGLIDRSFDIVPWNAGAGVLSPNNRILEYDKQSMKNMDFYANLSAQAAWQLRLRFEKTYKVIVKGEDFPPDELISIDSSIDYLEDLVKELSQPTFMLNPGSGKIIVCKKPDGTRSPNIADATKMAFFPIEKARILI